jgi:hypothetical protein
MAGVPAELVAITGDEVMAQSLFEAAGGDMEVCRQMLEESRQVRLAWVCEVSPGAARVRQGLSSKHTSSVRLRSSAFVAIALARDPSFYCCLVDWHVAAGLEPAMRAAVFTRDRQSVPHLPLHSQAARQLSPRKVRVVFEESEYNLMLPPQSTMTDVKLAVQEATHITPREQLLVDATTQVEPPAAITVSDLLSVTGADELVLHLLTPNSSA